MSENINLCHICAKKVTIPRQLTCCVEVSENICGQCIWKIDNGELSPKCPICRRSFDLGSINMLLKIRGTDIKFGQICKLINSYGLIILSL